MMNAGKKGVASRGRKLELPKKTNNGKSYKNDRSDDDFVERKNKMDSEKNEKKMKRKRVDKSVKDKKVKMAYADRVICEDVNLQRLRPFITEIDSEHLRVLEEYEVSRGVFGNLSLRENVDGVFYDEMMNQDHSKDRSVEESCGIIESMVGRLVEQKKVVEASSLMCMETHPNNDKMKAAIKKVVDIFNGTTLKALIADGHEDRMEVDGTSVNATEGEKSAEDMDLMITNLTNKMGKDLLSGPKVYSDSNVDASD
ncbi:unnamed protein product [Lactuca virosa]|uniref:Uncharacterized protein n=2 Tax=Lactuca virosa TaxID=75947 RepID=A0AAU9LG44_9ASTR|nr:unnamed protein product [Lactuca virosa]